MNKQIVEWTFTPVVKRTQEHLEDVTVPAHSFEEGWAKADRILQRRGVALSNDDGSRRIGYITKTYKEEGE